MLDVISQTVLSFFLSAILVIIITVIAEKYGTKVGGILGTLPSTIVVAFIFFSINKGLFFASEAASVIPAELGINLIFLCIFAILVFYSIYLAFALSFVIWGFCSFLLIVLDFSNIYLSSLIYVILLLFTFIILEYVKKIPSKSKVSVRYTPLKIMFRGILAGVVIALAVYLSNVGSVISGIFSVFPAILTSTMLICYKEHGPNFAAGMAKSMIFGISSVAVYATSIHFLYPEIGLVYGSIISYIISIFTTIIIFKLKDKIK